MRKTIVGALLLGTTLAGQAQSNIYEANGNVGIGIPSPNTKLHVLDLTQSRPGGVSAPTKASLKLSRGGTVNYSWPESAEFRLGHGGPGVWGSQLDLYVNGANNTSDVPDQHAMTWQYNGNVGIGTNAPSATLNINTSLSGNRAALKLGVPFDPGNIAVPFGGTTGGYNIDFATWRDMVPDQIGARIRGERINIYQENNALVQAMDLVFYTSRAGTQDNLLERLRIDSYGNVGIGVTTPNEKLTVNGKIRAKEIKVETGGDWADYVFEPTYKLMSLKETEAFIKKNKHLPNIPSASEVEKNGIELGNNQALLLAKIEELTLHIIELEKRIALQERKSGKK